MVPDQILTPDANAIRHDLEYMTARWGEIQQPCMFELRAFKEHAQPQVAKFSPDWMDDAVAWAEDMNERGYNLYVVRNPIRQTCGASATDDDIVAAFFLWADCDDGQAGENIKRWDGPRYSAAVVTGMTPSVRVHTYWALKEPCTDLTQWRETQSAIAKHFGSDKSVINPSRIMRVAGTVAYPFAKKRERGYTQELTTIRTEYPETREPVTIDQMRRAFGTPARADNWVDTGDAYGPALNRETARSAALSGQEWHNNMIRLVASYVAKGLSDAEIHGLTRDMTLAGYTDRDTHAEVQKAIEGARAKGWTPEPQPEPVTPTPETIQDFPILSSAEFLSDLEPLEYLIDGLLPRGVAYSLTGFAGHGKTTLALQIALSVALGEDFADRATSKGSVLILAGENPYNVKWQYAAALAARKLKAKDADVHFVSGRFSISQWSEVVKAKMAKMPELKLVIADSLQAFFEGDNDNDNMQMVEMAHRLRELCDISQRPALLIIAHPAGKTPMRDALVPRGGGAFLNEIDGNLTVWSQDASQQTLHHSQKFRGAGFDPIEFIMQVHEFDHLTDSNGTPLKLPVSRPELSFERSGREAENDKALARYLETVDAGQPLSVREGASQLRISRWRMQCLITTAKEEKLIRRHAKTYKITDGGKDFLAAHSAGI